MQPVIDAVVLMLTTFKKMFDAAFDLAMSALERAQLALEAAKCHIDRACESCKLEMSAVVLLNLPEDRKNFLCVGLFSLFSLFFFPFFFFKFSALMMWDLFAALSFFCSSDAQM